MVHPFGQLRHSLVATVAVFVVLGVAAYVVEPRIIDAVRAVQRDEERTSFLPRGREATPDTPPPVGLQRGSLLVRGNLAPALRRLRERAGPSRVRRLRIAPDRVDVQVVTSERRLRVLQHRAAGDTQVLADTSARGAGAMPSFAWSQVDAAAPRRLVERVAPGARSREIDFVSLAAEDGRQRWIAVLTGGDGFSARADGRGVRRIGG